MSEKVLCVVGVGPGDPELITVKAVNALAKSDFIFYPDVTGGKNKIAYDIIKSALKFAGMPDVSEEKFIPLEVEMKRSTGRNGVLYEENALKIIDKFMSGADLCSYATIGDPMFYSTYWGLYNALKAYMNTGTKVIGSGIDVKIIGGVSSFHYAFGLIGEPYIAKNSSVLISVPVHKDLSEIENEIKFITGKLHRPQVIVFMKAGSYVREILDAFNRLCGSELETGGLKLYLIEKSILVDDFINKKESDFDYFSILAGVFL